MNSGRMKGFAHSFGNNYYPASSSKKAQDVGNLNRVGNGSSSGAKKSSCKFCGQIFRSGAYCVRRHERIHTGEKPFSCRGCSKSFSQSHNRHRHEKTIHGFERPALVSRRAQKGRVSFGKSTEIRIGLTGDQADEHSDDVPIAVSASTLPDSFFNIAPKKPMPLPRQNPPSKKIPAQKSVPSPAYFKCKYCCAKFKEMAHAKGHSAMCFTRFRIEKPSPFDFQFPTFPGFSSVKRNQSNPFTSPPTYQNTESAAKYGKNGISPQSAKNQKSKSPMGHYRCQFCSYSSKQLRDVQIHENIHTGAKPFKCGHCNFRTGNPGRLSEHRRANPRCSFRANTCKPVQERPFLNVY